METYFRKIPLIKNLLGNESYLVISFHHSILQLAYITQAWIFWILELVPCKQTYEMHIQMHPPSLWACSPYLCAQNFNWSLTLSYLSPYVNFSISPPLLSFHYLCTLFLPLCHQWPQRFTLDRLRLSMSINGVRIIS